MRPIKYRAWDKTEKKMYDLRDMYFNVSIDHPRVVFEMPFEMVDEDWKDHDLVLLAFTGLTDRNGTEIYEGDIVVGKPPHYTDEVKGVVKYGALAFAFVGKTKKGKEWFDTITNPRIKKADHIEVIGNIYENPGLLKGE
jgi:uncharacterized phage protein (TIGR01671 family)